MTDRFSLSVWDHHHRARPGQAAVAGLAGFVPVAAAAWLLGRFGDNAPRLGFLVPFLLALLLVVAVGWGGALPARALGADWPVAVLGALGSHLICLLLAYTVVAYAGRGDPSTPTFVLAIGCLVLLLLADRGLADHRWLAALALATLALALFAWLAPLPRYTLAAVAWAVVPALGARAELDEVARQARCSES